MKVELHYDPVRPSTTVFVDGRAVDRHNIYGFLYPVRRCILQTWLPASGSWNGLRRQLEELARGEPVELAFYGRPIDFEDVRAELGDDVSFQLEENVEAYRKMLDQAEQDMAGAFTSEQKVSSEPVVIQRGSDLFPEETDEMARLFASGEKKWLLVIDSEEAFDSARRGEGCCLVKEPFLSGFAAVDRLPQLAGSMLRARDMVCCAVDSAEKREELLVYARQFPQLAVRFVDERDSGWKEALDAKYGVPFRLRQRLQRAIAGLDLLERCYQREHEFSSEHSALSKAVENGEALKVKQRNHRAYQLRWLQLQRSTFERLKKALRKELSEQGEGRE